jgi:hypothetical protein
MSRPRGARAPFVLLGLMTIASFGGPFALVATIRGGASPDWPPDRAIEWWAFSLTTGLVAVLMTACLVLGLARWRKDVARTESGAPAGSEKVDSRSA